jgi:cytochrome c oxidase cbb3-type subunit 3
LEARFLPAAAVLAAAVGIACLARAIYSHHMIDRLLAAEPGPPLHDAALLRFARARAAPLYAQYCSSCHGSKLRGDPSKGVPDLTDGDWLYGSGEVPEIERVILYGIRSGNGKGWNLADMPAYARERPYLRDAIDPLTPADIRDTVEYLRRIEGRPADFDAAKRGGDIYGGRGACYDCHGSDGSGDPAIGAPNLKDDIWLYGDGSRESVFDSIARGHRGACPAWARRLAAWEVRVLAVYVYGFSRHP